MYYLQDDSKPSLASFVDNRLTLTYGRKNLCIKGSPTAPPSTTTTSTTTSTSSASPLPNKGSDDTSSGGDGNSGGGMTPAGIFFLVISLLFIVYMIGGSVYNCTRGETRFPLYIPNHEFW